MRCRCLLFVCSLCFSHHRHRYRGYTGKIWHLYLCTLCMCEWSWLSGFLKYTRDWHVQQHNNFIYTIRVVFFCLSLSLCVSLHSFSYQFVGLFGSFIPFVRLACCWPTKNSKMLLKSQYQIEPFYWKTVLTRISCWLGC